MSHLEFSCRQIEISTKPGEMVEGSFTISSQSESANGEILTSDTRMRISQSHFEGTLTKVVYVFDGSNADAGQSINGEFVILSNQGEYKIPFIVNVENPILISSLGMVKNLFLFANLAKSSWHEAVALFYDPNFIHIFQTNERHLIPIYLGLSQIKGNQANVEEFLLVCNKKSEVKYVTDLTGFELENIMDSTVRTIIITKSEWGYTNLLVTTEGGFLEIPTTRLQNEDFMNNTCSFTFMIDATKLHTGVNSGKITIQDSKNKIDIIVTININAKHNNVEKMHKEQKALNCLMDAYVARKLKKISRDTWLEKSQAAIDLLESLDEDKLMTKLYAIQLLLTRERFEDAKLCLDALEKEVFSKKTDVVEKCYYLYLYTLYNRDENFLKAVMNEIDTDYGNNRSEWRLALLLMYLDDDFVKSKELKWKFLEELFKLGCCSPALLCESTMILYTNPGILLKLDAYEQNVVWFAAKEDMLSDQIIQQVLYISARINSYSLLMYRILTRIYEKTKAPQAVAAICRLLILGDKKGTEYFQWYALGIEMQVRVTKLYEYYMMSVDLNYQGKLPKIVLMYFAYQSNLDYERNAFLYSYIIRNQDDYPELEENYRIDIERFVIDQIKAGHINENLAYLYENIIAPQMLRDEMAYAFTPLLFMHKLIIPNDNIKSVVVIHEKIFGESVYPVKNNECYLSLYGNEYSVFLQDENNNRFYSSVPYENIRFLEHDKLIAFIGMYIKGRLSFDIFQCENDKNYITINEENLSRFRNLVDSPQVIISFKKEIRTRLLHYYYDNDMIGELDAFLEETDAEAMEESERAEFIRFLISRGMFEKAYRFVKMYGIGCVTTKAAARLISNIIVTNEYLFDQFLVDSAFYIYKNTRYDEHILKYLLLHYNGTSHELRNIWKSAKEINISNKDIMNRMLRQMQYTGVHVPEKHEILLSYDEIPEHDEDLVKELFVKTAEDFFVNGEVIMKEVFDRLYERYRQMGTLERIEKLALLKFWAENPDIKADILPSIIGEFVQELLNEGKVFPFFTGLVNDVAGLHYFKDKTYVEYKSCPDSVSQIHYMYVDGLTAPEDCEQNYITEDLCDMYGGICVKAFDLFHGECLQYYITEIKNGEETTTESNIIYGPTTESYSQRFAKLNDCLIGISMQDEQTTKRVLEDYMYQDFVVRELFRVI